MHRSILTTVSGSVRVVRKPLIDSARFLLVLTTLWGCLAVLVPRHAVSATEAQQLFPTRPQALTSIEKSGAFANIPSLPLAEGDSILGGVREGLWIETDTSLRLSLTSEGRRHFAQIEGFRVALTPTARRQLTDVTGISGLPFGGDLVNVDFRWSWLGLSEVAARYTGLINNAPRAGKAVLQRYDDGWRVQNVELDDTTVRFVGVPADVSQREVEARDALFRQSTKTLGTWTFPYRNSAPLFFGGPHTAELRVTDKGVNVTDRNSGGEASITATWQDVERVICPSDLQAPFLSVQLRNAGIKRLALVQTTDDAASAKAACSAMQGALSEIRPPTIERVIPISTAIAPTHTLQVHEFKVESGPDRGTHTITITDTNVTFSSTRGSGTIGYEDVAYVVIGRGFPGGDRVTVQGGAPIRSLGVTFGASDTSQAIALCQTLSAAVAQFKQKYPSVQKTGLQLSRCN